MKLRIDKTSHLITSGLVSYIVLLTKRVAALNADKAVLSNFDKAIKDAGCDCTAYELFIRGLDALTFTEGADGFLITVNSNQKIGKNKRTISSLMRLIDSGTAEIRPYPILSETLSFIKKNLGSIIDMYLIAPM